MPSLRASGTGSVSSNSQVTSLAVPIGTGVAAGDLIVIVAAWNATAAGTTFTTPTGFTVASSTTDSGASAICSVGTFYKIATGAEAGTTVTVTHSATGRCAAVSAAFQSTNGTFDGAIPAATKDNGAVGGTTNPTNPALSGLTYTNDLSILLLGAKQDVASATAMTFTAPTGYTVAISKSGTSSAGNNGAAAIAYKGLSTNSDTPGAWTLGESAHWIAVTIPLEDTTPTGGSGPQTQTSGFPTSTAAAYGPTLVPVVTEPAGAATRTPSAYGPTLLPGAATEPAGFASHAAAASGPTLVPGAVTKAAGFASHAAAANGVTFSSPVTKAAGIASSSPAAYGANVRSVTLLQAGFAGHSAAASGPTMLPGAKTQTAGFAAHAASAFGVAMNDSIKAGFASSAPVARGVTLAVRISAGEAVSAAAARGPALLPGAVAIPAGAATRGAAASGPLFHAAVSLPAGAATRQSVAFGVDGFGGPVIILGGRADARPSADQLVAAGSALSAAASASGLQASTPPGSTQATAAASTVGVSVNV